MKMFSWYSDSRETHTNLTVSFRLERGGQFESGFQLYLTKIQYVSSISIKQSQPLTTLPKGSGFLS